MSQPRAPQSARELFAIVGPGLVVAATGVGAGDLVAAAKAGATHGLPLLWTAVVGAILKFVLAEGIARWQLASGCSILEGWMRILGRTTKLLFLIYLLLWTFVVAAALMSACGLATHALVPQISVRTGAVLHALLALCFVWFGRYAGFEKTMKIIIGLMFVSLMGSALLQRPDPIEVLEGLFLPEVPGGSTVLALGVIGGVGGTLTLLSYNYWMREKRWQGAAWIRGVRFDLLVGYGLTGIFGIAVMLLAGTLLQPRGIEVSGSSSVLQMATLLSESFGTVGRWVFLLGFWGAVASSLLGVWQGVPYLFQDYLRLLKSKEEAENPQRLPGYRGYLLFMTFPPMLLLLWDRPVWLIVVYAALGALFMPFLAITLLILNNRRSLVGELRNGILANAGLVLCVFLFLYLAVVEIWNRFRG